MRYALILLIMLFGIITEWFMFPLAWLCRNWKFNPFWIWLDDSRLTETGLAPDYLVFLEIYDTNIETFWLAYRWHVQRNRVWNLLDLFILPIGDETVIDLKIDKLYRDGQKIKQGGRWAQVAGLKYKAKGGQDSWQVNIGEEIDYKYSILGTGYITFFKGDSSKKYWRYSQCKIVRYFIFWKRYRTLKFGAGNRRYIIACKYQKI